MIIPRGPYLPKILDEQRFLKLRLFVSLTARPEICNTDQGSQFTSDGFIGVLKDAGIAISMDGRGRVFDNIFVERLWRSVKYEEVYLKDYETVDEARQNLAGYFHFYNYERLHQSLGYLTPAEVYFGYEADLALSLQQLAGDSLYCTSL